MPITFETIEAIGGVGAAPNTHITPRDAMTWQSLYEKELRENVKKQVIIECLAAEIVRLKSGNAD